MTQNEFKPADFKETLDKEFGNAFYVKFQIMEGSYADFLKHIEKVVTEKIPGLNAAQIKIMMRMYKESYPEGLYIENRM